MPYTVTDIQRIVDAQRAFFRTGQTLDIKWRLARLKHFSGLMCFPSLTTKVYKMPYGVTLVISPFNFPVLLTLGVLAKAADNLTPVALELGGETGNWCIVRKDADIADAARKTAFVRQIGENAQDNEEYPKLITRQAYDKCSSLADEYRERIVFGGKRNADSLRYAPTVIYPVGIDEDIVRKELFCPLLPVVPFRDGRISRRVGFPRIHSCIDCPEGKHPLQSFYAGAPV